jgi:hypothetical protein
MRFLIPPKLVPKLRELQEQSRQFYIDKIAESEDAVVMTLGLGDAMYLALDGRVIVDEFTLTEEEDKPPREAKDAKEMYAAIVVGAKQRNAPELLSLLPSRPEAAVDCAACKNSGWFFFGADAPESLKVICSECGGVGWKGGDEHLFEVA